MAAPVWILHDGKIGLRNQAMGVAEAVGLPFEDRQLDIRLPWRALPPALWWRALDAQSPGAVPLAPPWPQLVIGAGGRAAAPALAIKRAAGNACLAVHVQNPHCRRNAFDLLIVPEHDRLRGRNVMVTQGAVHRVTRAKLDLAAIDWTPRLAHLPQPRIAVLLGGANGSFTLPPERAGEIAGDLARLAESGYGLMITPSRRTPPESLVRIREATAGLPVEIWDGVGENPYFGYLGLADFVLATADSVSMITEATATGRPVYVLDLPGGAAKFRRFHAAMNRAGLTRPFLGQIESWTYPPRDDTGDAGRVIRAMLEERGLAS